MSIINALVDVVMGIALDAGTGVVVGFLTGRSHNRTTLLILAVVRARVIT